MRSSCVSAWHGFPRTAVFFPLLALVGKALPCQPLDQKLFIALGQPLVNHRLRRNLEKVLRRRNRHSLLCRERRQGVEQPWSYTGPM